MKKLLLLILLINLSVYGQESFRTVYYLKENTISYEKKKRPQGKLKKLEKKTFSNLSSAQQKAYLKMSKADYLLKWEKEFISKFKLGDTITEVYKESINGNIITSKKKIALDRILLSKYRDKISDSLDKVKVEMGVPVKPYRRMKGAIKFDKGKLYFNPHKIRENNGNLIKNKTKDLGVYYLDFKNREYVWLPFYELTFTSLTIPLKYRFESKNKGLKEDYSSSINLNLFLGFSYGNSRFERREKVGDKTKTWKLTSGLIFGTSTVKLDNANTSLAIQSLEADESITKGLVSLGFGITYSLNSINIGAFYGWDYSIGENAEKWNYNKEPWLGVGLGYSLFKL